MDPNLEALAAALSGGKSRFYSQQPAASVGPVVSPQGNAAQSSRFLAEALSNRAAPQTIGSGIYDASKSIGNALTARSKRQEAEADQEKATATYNDLAASLSTGTTDYSGEAEGATPVTKPGAMDPNDPMLQLANAMASSGRPNEAMGLLASIQQAQRAAETASRASAVEHRRKLEIENTKSTNTLDNELAKLNATHRLSESERTTLQKNLERAGYKPGTKEYQEAVFSAVTKPQVSIGNQMTPGAKESDKAAAKTYNAWVTEGGAADYRKNLEQLREVRDQMVDKDGKPLTDDLTGPIIGSQSRNMRAITVPKSLAAQEAVEEVVQRNLRIILGPQFTEKEGERLISRSYNPMLEEAENGRRLNRLLEAMESAYEVRNRAMKYFEKHNTMTGFSGELPTLQSIEKAAGLDDDSIGKDGGNGASKGGVSEGTIIESPDPNKPDLIMRGGKWVPHNG